jgi:hypothetical protein
MNKKLFLRVRREISNLKRIRHSNVVQIYESKRLHTTRIITSVATSNYVAKPVCVALYDLAKFFFVQVLRPNLTL